MDDNAPSLVERAFRPALGGTLVVLIVSLAWPFLATPGSPTIVDFGQWLSGIAQPLAIFWFVLAFLLQREELRLQRRELQATRAELSRQAESLAESELNSRRDTFAKMTEVANETCLAIARAISIRASAEVSVTHHEHWPGPLSTLEQVVTFCADKAQGSHEHLARIERAKKFRSSQYLNSHGRDFIQLVDGLLELSAECGAGGLFTKAVRSRPFFAYYQLLHRVFGTEPNSLGAGSQSADYYWDSLKPR